MKIPPHSLKDGIASQDWRSKKATSNPTVLLWNRSKSKQRSNIEVRLDYTIWDNRWKAFFHIQFGHERQEVSLQVNLCVYSKL